MEDEGRPTDWVARCCLDYTGCDPQAFMESLFEDERCVAFGPIHHFLVGAVLLTCYRNAGGDTGASALEEHLEEMVDRSDCVPGAACAKWGVCGAAASVGMAYAIVRDNAPLKKAGWSEDQLIVASILKRIAMTGSPRCCKRDSRIALDEAVPHFNRLLERPMATPSQSVVCNSMAQNKVCMGPACPYHPVHVR